MLRISVCLKISLDTAQLKADPQTRAPRLENAPLRVGSIDENALEEAVRLKERHGGEVRAVMLVGAPPPEELVLRVLAMGADEAVQIVDETLGAADALATATLLAAALRKLPAADLILCGEGSLDEYNRQVGPRIGEALGLPILTHVTKLALSDGRIEAERALEDRAERVACALPALLTVSQEINQPRFAAVLQILGASKKPRVVWGLRDLELPEGVSASSLAGLRTLEVAAPASARRRIVVDGETPAARARSLARRLLEEGALRLG
ncbi:MAG: electron transfer flavoprotein subunit beta/FixA family protein [Myxococcales bacterium]|nr:electron transfer flavoprotein subunit beta/FixA family protein [Myxococcales bacterium]